MSVRFTTTRPRRGGGFTLVELLVVIGVIVLLAAIALPSMIKLFTAGADAQAHNVLAAQTTAARALAIKEGTYAGVHVEFADASLRSTESETCYTAILILDDASGAMVPAPGYTPKKIPGRFAFGEVTGAFVGSDNNYKDLDGQLNSGNLQNFTSFTIVFSPAGQVVKQVKNADIKLGNLIVKDGGNTDFAKSGILFGTSQAKTDYPEIILWADSDGRAAEPGVTAITMFNAADLLSLEDAADRVDYLNENGQFLPVNVYTGQLFPRQ